MNAKLYDAVNTFKNLGWEAVAAENVLALPLPVGEEKQTALAGLKSGEWGEFAELEKNRYGYRSFVDVNEGKLALFAIRLGVDARRAVTIANNGDPEALIAVIQQRGDTYATNFIEYACTSSGRMWEHSASVFGKIAVWLVDRMCLDIPQSVEYLKDWSVYAAVALGLKAETRYKETDFPELECIERRFDEHVRVGVAVNVPATGPFGAVFSAGAKRGWLSREEALALAFLALNTAVRPGDRRIWLQVLDILDVRDEELFERTQALIPLLALSDTSVIARLAPVLIERSSDSLRVEVLLAAFSATTKKARQLVLKAALNRPRPENAEDLAAWLSLFAEDKDKSVASLAKRLISQWEIEVEALAEEEPAVQGLWRETPPLWQAPAFDRGGSFDRTDCKTGTAGGRC